MRRMNKTLEYAMKSELRRGGNNTLNIYLLDPSPYLGYTYYPTILQVTNNSGSHDMLDSVTWSTRV